MMKLCNESVTVYNSYVDSITKYREYIPTVLTNVSWFGDLQVNVSNAGLISASRYMLRIPDYVESYGKTFVMPKTYESIPLSEKSNYWTLAEGDCIVRGAKTDSGPDVTPATLKDKYDDVITVLSVTDNRRVKNAPHWRVIGK